MFEIVTATLIALLTLSLIALYFQRVAWRDAGDRLNIAINLRNEAESRYDRLKSSHAGLQASLSESRTAIYERDDNIKSQANEITTRDGRIASLTMELQEKTRELVKFIKLNESNLEIKENMAAHIRNLGSDLQRQTNELIRLEEIIDSIDNTISHDRRPVNAADLLDPRLIQVYSQGPCRPPHANDGRTAEMGPG